MNQYQYRVDPEVWCQNRSVHYCMSGSVSVMCFSDFHCISNVLFDLFNAVFTKLNNIWRLYANVLMHHLLTINSINK